MKWREIKGAHVGLIILFILAMGLVIPIRADEEYHVIATMQAPTLTSSGGFGTDLALYEDLLLISEYEADLGDLRRVGRAYIFDSDWNLVTSLQAPSPKEYEVFGEWIDMWGDTLAISNVENVGDIEGAGKVYIYDSEGVLLTDIQSPEPEIGAGFGMGICVYRDLLLVAESWKNEQGFIDAGLVQVFSSEGDFLSTIHSPSPANVGLFGLSIDANDEFILVGECGHRGWPIDEGNVHVYDVDYNLVETLLSPDYQERSGFGISVAISENIFVIGEFWASVDGHEKAGRAHIYDTDWNLVAMLQSPTPEENGEFGIHVAIGGGLVVVGERRGDVVSMNEGKAYVFDLEGNLIDTLVSPDPEVGAQFGWRVATDGEIVVVADAFHSVDDVSRAGYVYVFGKGTAIFEVDDLTIDPISVDLGGTLTISVEVTNTGAKSGTHTVALMIDGEVEDEKTVTLSPDESETVSFEVSASQLGTFSVEVDDLSGSYTVTEPKEEPTFWERIPGFPFESIVFSMVLAVLVLWLIRRQR